MWRRCANDVTVRVMTTSRGLIFDLDGTLMLTQEFHYEAFHAVFEKHGMPYTIDDDMYKYAGMGSGSIFPAVFADHGVTLTKEEVEEMSSEKKELYWKIVHERPIELVRGVEGFLQRMHEAGYPMCIASGNKPEAIEYLLERTGIRYFFSRIVTNKDVARPKPHPDIFLKGAEVIGVEPGRCVVFEDAVNGVEAAGAAKIPCIALATRTPAEQLRNAGARLVISDYTKLGKDPFSALE